MPLAVIQIDHTKLDLIVVDEVDRRPLARPWLTVATDVFSRTVAGFYLSLEAPSAACTGMCVACAILPKDSLLARWGISTRWPVWGKMAAIHCDNGKDFRGAMLRRAFLRSVESSRDSGRCASPTEGGHIERLMGTFALEASRRRNSRQTHSTPPAGSSPSSGAEFDRPGRAPAA